MSLDPALHAHRHDHSYVTGNTAGERNTRRAVVLTAAMMLAEIAGGWIFNSMALLADGWHMSSHVLALGLSLLAYASARRFARDRRFAFGTWKIEILGGYTSAVLLLCVALLMAVQSLQRLVNPLPIHYDQAIVLGVLGLAVNLVCAWWLKDDHSHHHHGHDHGHDHGHHAHGHPGEDHHAPHADLNLRAAYVHVLADAATSVLAIVALLAGRFFGASWLDPVMGIAGAVLVTVWAIGLLRSTGRVLLDAEMDAPVVEEVREVIAELPQPTAISDLHVWRVGRGQYAAILGLVTTRPLSPQDVRAALAIHEELVHVTVEINAVQPA
ncbi:CDF family Co(II)/Ni(II) efflux transporter DmeF [Pseudoxanthomonas spadix]|jgi:cation diffusion facilitator family transporter|uniref:Cation diffusion facilitator family transporter n=1 Tax=Pseudoxanthomonas spadix (strain BD-a59) TaxID=1045855 RepID=G7USW6_PSEUP|nr:CDF family Co(II)/Ni(II) efflux transporter DmeF [Pseudoxanthomonas spadix]AER54827.1 cation diffusion facilitator family transporter [Pseudoxanthomonas spadix BD-a59]MBP3974737.1 CDF family Co(II)/Ni(II) efflux transporter DmeF [Pseudoxanthomonas spadix]RMW92878.1 cation transporter [Pseudoxanthomonas spadix]